jgi:two-component system C4-dicarboxylate transport sensor histidine kinase DctB
MGRITNQLKLFIGKARPRDVNTPVIRAIVNAARLLDARLDGITVGIWYDPVCRLDDTPVPLKDPEIGFRVAIKASQQAAFTLDGAISMTLEAGLSPLTTSSQLPDTPAVWCDQLRLEQLLINVIGNAADALQGVQRIASGVVVPPPRIDLVISATSSTVTLAILDNGPGIADDALGHLFEPFFTTKDSNAGLGLGLAISAAIASEYGGSLRAVNRTDGSSTLTASTPGAAFILTLRRVADIATQQLLDVSSGR